jgi:hypothetical protein
VSEVDAIELLGEFWARWVRSHQSWIFFIAAVIRLVMFTVRVWRMLDVEVNARISMAQVASLLDFIEL